MTLLRTAVLKALPLLCLAAWACSPSSPTAGGSPVVTSASPQAPAARPAALPQAPATGFAVKSVLAAGGQLEPGDYLWEPQLATEGEVRIVVDLVWQLLHVYRDGHEIGRARIVYGADDKPTPLGTFPILEKDADHVSNLYDAEMPYMMRLTWDGVAIHGSIMAADVATNGCVGVPDEFAALVFREVKLGTLVTVTKNWPPNTAAAQAEADAIPAPSPATLPTI
jgi:lipoprotein-anchoring transpeptidase ErfK/SrfK